MSVCLPLAIAVYCKRARMLLTHFFTRRNLKMRTCHPDRNKECAQQVKDPSFRSGWQIRILRCNGYIPVASGYKIIQRKRKSLFVLQRESLFALRLAKGCLHALQEFRAYYIDSDT